MKTTAATPLTDRQREVFRAIVTHYRDTGRPPSIRDLQGATGIASQNGLVCHLRPLKKKGLIGIAVGEARGISVPEIDAAIRAAAGAMLEREDAGHE